MSQPHGASTHMTSATSALDPSIMANEHRADLTKAEYFDLLTPEGAQTGKTKLRSDVHRDGDWHASVHIWLLNSKDGKILLQKRASCKDSFPSCWDVSCAGHLAAGETAESAAIAELAEELGIVKPADVDFNRFFHQLPTLRRTVISQGGKFIDNEHTYIYYLEGDWKASELVLQEEEVEAVEWMEIDDLIKHLASKNPKFVDIPDLESYSKAVFQPLIDRSRQIRARNEAA